MVERHVIVYKLCGCQFHGSSISASLFAGPLKGTEKEWQRLCVGHEKQVSGMTPDRRAREVEKLGDGLPMAHRKTHFIEVKTCGCKEHRTHKENNGTVVRYSFKRSVCKTHLGFKKPPPPCPH
jgi:hypothetical protein